MEEQLRVIHERNRRVESDKAWETSWFRIGSITAITYIIAVVAMYAIGATNIFRNALIPTIGFFLSVQSLPFLKRWWVKKRWETRK